MDTPRDVRTPEKTAQKTRFVITHTLALGPLVEGEAIGTDVLRIDRVPTDPGFPNFAPDHLDLFLPTLRHCAEEMLKDGTPGGLFLRPYQEGLLPGPGLYCLHVRRVDGADPLPPFTGEGERDLLLALLARFAKACVDGTWEVSLDRILGGTDLRRLSEPTPAPGAPRTTFRLSSDDWRRGMLALQRWQATLGARSESERNSR